MKITWLFEKDLWKEENDAMKLAVENLGYTWKNIEINSFSSSGLYSCDKMKIVKEVSELTLNLKSAI